MSWNGSERREHKRAGIKGCTLQYKSARCFGLFSSLSNRYLILNICQDGLCFISKEDIKEGNRLLFSFTAPLLNSSAINAKGLVIWAKKSPQYEAYRCGIKFISMGHSAEKKLRFILDNALLDQIDIPTRIYLKEVDKL
jgi:hypothetical protein